MIIATDNYRDLQFLDMPFKTISLNEFLKDGKIVDLVYFSGGEDVDPILYGHTKLSQTYSNIRRDVFEYRVYNLALQRGIPCFGICRGSQFLTAVQPNGMLVQHTLNHALSTFHNIKVLYDNTIVPVTSTHHQMMYPYNVRNHELLATSEFNLSNLYLFGLPKEESSEKSKILLEMGEPEIVFYPDTKCLAVQGHPEYIIKTSHPFPKLVTNLIKNKLL